MKSSNFHKEGKKEEKKFDAMGQQDSTTGHGDAIRAVPPASAVNSQQLPSRWQSCGSLFACFRSRPFFLFIALSWNFFRGLGGDE